MGSSLRRQLREALPDSVKGLPRAVALEIADDARWDDGWRYNPETGRRSKATLSDLVRWTAAKNERVIGDALRTLALAGWEFRVPFGKGKDGRPLYAVPGRAVEFRVPDFEAPTEVGSTEPEGPVTTGPFMEGPVAAGPLTPEGPVTTAEGPAVAAEGPVTTGAGPVTTGPPSHVPSYSHQDSPSTTSPVEVPDDDPAVAPEPTTGGGGSSDLRSLAVEIAASLDYRGKPPTTKQRKVIEDRLVVFLEAGWSLDELVVHLDLTGQAIRYAPAVYIDRLDPVELSSRRPSPAAPQPFRGGARGYVPTGAEIEALTLADVLGDGRPDTADGGMWERSAARARKKTAALAGAAGHVPYSNDSWLAPADPVASAKIPWCGDLDCDEKSRMRDGVDHNGLPFVYQCEKCHPNNRPW